MNPPLPTLRPLPSRRPSGIPEEDLRSVLAPYLLRQRDALQRRLQRQEAENKQLADAVLAGRRQLAELQQQGQARWQAWQVSGRPCPQPCPPAAAARAGEVPAGWLLCDPPQPSTPSLCAAPAPSG